MPSKSESQRKFLYATKGADWVKRHHFDTKGRLPARSPMDSLHKLLGRKKKKRG